MSKTLEEIRRLTASILDADEAEEYVAQITEESIKEMKDAVEKDTDYAFANSAGMEDKCNMYYGHDMRYDGNNYLFRASDGCPGNGCGMQWWRLNMNYWNHQFRSRRCGNHNNLAELRFTRR